MMPYPTLNTPRQKSNSQLTLRRNSPNRTAHIRHLGIIRPSHGAGFSAVEDKFSAALGAPPGNAVMRAIDIHLAVAESLPESVDADGAQLRPADRIDHVRGQGEPFFEVLHAEEAEGVDHGEGQRRLFGEGRGFVGFCGWCAL